jgi:ABC-type antimicrobial peptide transport system permease subunit
MFYFLRYSRKLLLLTLRFLLKLLKEFSEMLAEEKKLEMTIKLLVLPLIIELPNLLKKSLITSELIKLNLKTLIWLSTLLVTEVLIILNGSKTKQKFLTVKKAPLPKLIQQIFTNKISAQLQKPVLC